MQNESNFYDASFEYNKNRQSTKQHKTHAQKNMLRKKRLPLTIFFQSATAAFIGIDIPCQISDLNVNSSMRYYKKKSIVRKTKFLNLISYGKS